MAEHPGTCRILWDRGGMRIMQADPEVWFSAILLDAIARGDGADGCTYGDGILTIRADNGTVSYGIGEPVPNRVDAYVGRKSPERAADA